MIGSLTVGPLTAFDWLLLVLAAWRVSVLLVEEDGPYRVFARLRQYAPYPVGGDATRSGVLHCVWCLSVWIAPLVVLGWLYLGTAGRLAVLMLATSGGVIFAQELMRQIRGV